MRCNRLKTRGFFAVLGLLGTNLDRKALASFFPAAGEYFAAIFGFHTLTIAVRLYAFLFAGLPRTFHELLLLIAND